MSLFLKDKIRITCENLLKQSEVRKDTITDIEFVKTNGYKTDNSFPKDGWQTFYENQRIIGCDEHFWFRTSIKTPKSNNKTFYLIRCITGREGQWDAINPQGLIYLNGKMTCGCDTNHTDVILEADTEYQIHNYMYTGTSSTCLGDYSEVMLDYSMQLVEINTEIEQLYYDIFAAFEACLTCKEDSDEYISVMSVLEQTVNLIDMREIYSDTYFQSIEKARKFIKEELYNKLCSKEKKPIISCIGHTHIDVEWLWARAQTREKIQRSFSTAAHLMKRYPEYLFTLSQPELYRYLKEEAPDKYEELKELVKEKRWEPEGAMWVEADCNLISGESFIRQIIHGKKFFMEEFGKDCKILFLPDVFGYSSALPQILKKCGIEHFVTSKISWNETNTLPYDTFMWQGIDGTEIFTNFITAQDYTDGAPERGTTYVGMLTPSQIKGAWKRYSQKEYCNRTFTTFGFGDGGGGPTKKMLETQRRLSKGLPGMPVTEMSFLLPHLEKARAEFDESCKRLGRIPKWVGELYLEFHRGTYTSMAKNKRNNRKSEFLLNKAEALSQITSLYGLNYDKAAFDKCWRKVLHNQFHDIIPGSSIYQVYERTDRDYAEIKEKCNGISENRLKFISENTKESGNLLYNPLGFDRKGIVKLNGKTFETAQSVPAFGWNIERSLITENSIKIKNHTAENEFYILTLDNAGRISRLFDKQNCREVFKSGELGNEIQAFEDYPRCYDNWEITDYYKDKKWVLDGNADIEAFSDGSSAGFKVTKKYLSSEIIQYIRLYTENRRIDFETEIEWNQKHQLLKAAFPFDIHVTSAVYETQFGNIERPTHENTSWDKAKFEVCGHKWVDMSESGYGVALLNDCKYGYNAEGNTLKITLLKCGSYPNELADIGRHRFTYSLLPHIGDFRQGGVVTEAYSLNQPLECRETKAGTGILPDSFSLISCDKENIIIETVKREESGDGTIIRLYDVFNAKVTATLTVNGGYKKAYLCDMLENELEELDFNGKQLKIRVKNFEIITLKFKKQQKNPDGFKPSG